MAKFVLKDAFVSLNSVTLSDHVESLTLTYEAATPEDTSMSDNAVTRLPGLKNFTLDVTFRHDFADSNVDDTLFALVGQPAFAIEIRPTSASASQTNPKYTGNVLLASMGVLGGSVGDVASSTVSFVGDGLLTRTES